MTSPRDGAATLKVDCRTLEYQDAQALYDFLQSQVGITQVLQRIPLQESPHPTPGITALTVLVAGEITKKALYIVTHLVKTWLFTRAEFKHRKVEVEILGPDGEVVRVVKVK